MSEPDEHDDLVGVDVFTLGRIAKLERHAELARALTASPEKLVSVETDPEAFIDALAARVLRRLRETGDLP